MYFVYVLFCADGKLYIGYSTNIQRRLEEHLSGRVKSTCHRRPVRLFYYEQYCNQRDAKAREIFLKSGAGHQQLKRQHQHQLAQFGYKYL